MTIESLLTHECTIQRQTKTNTDGRLVASWNDTFATGVACLLQEGRGEIRARDSGRALVYDAILFLLPDQDIRPRGQDDIADRIAMTSPAALVGISFMALAVVDESGQAHHLTAYLRRLPSGN